MESLAASTLTLTPYSTPREIYTQIFSLKDLRYQSSQFEAALSKRQRDVTNEERGSGHAKRHSTCFKLYQAVRPLKKRDNKKDKTERLYPTLAAAFDAHRQKTLSQDGDDENSGCQHAETADPHWATVNISLPPPPPRASVVTVPTAAGDASEAAQLVGGASGSMGLLHFQDGDQASSTSHTQSAQSSTTRSAQASSVPIRQGEMDDVRRVVCQLLESTSRVHAQLRVAEAEVGSLQAQLNLCQLLLTTWKVKGAEVAEEDQGLTAPTQPHLTAPAEAVACSASSIGDRAPSSPLPQLGHEGLTGLALGWEEAAETTSDVRPAAPTQTSCVDDACDERGG